MPLFSVIIPTNRPQPILERCLQALAAQRLAFQDLEVIVVYNGVAAPPVWAADRWPYALTVAQSAPANVGAARNVGFRHARGEWVLLLNDDVLAQPDLIAAHLAAHRALCRPALVLGETVWQRYDDETIFDRMIQTTSMVFFYDRMPPHAWYNFRHAWTLNLSLPRRYCDMVRFDETLRPVNFDDLEWAFRLERACGLRVWYAPEARAVHDHRYTVEQYLAREHQLGEMAALLWRCNPACYRAIYGAGLDEVYLDYCRQFVRREGQRAAEMYQQLRQIVSRRPEELGSSPQMQNDVVQSLYFAHLPLKRLAFRRGLLSAAEKHRAPPRERPSGPASEKHAGPQRRPTRAAVLAAGQTPDAT